MDLAIWIAVFIPIFVILFVVLPQQHRRRNIAAAKVIKQRKVMYMASNKALEKYVGKRCKIRTMLAERTISGEIMSVDEKWVEVKTKNATEMVNADFIERLHVESE